MSEKKESAFADEHEEREFREFQRQKKMKAQRGQQPEGSGFYRLRSGSHVQGSGETTVTINANNPARCVLWSQQDLAKADPVRWEKLDGPPETMLAPPSWPVGPMTPAAGTRGDLSDPLAYLPRPPVGAPMAPWENAPIPDDQRASLEQMRESFQQQHEEAIKNAKEEFLRVQQATLQKQQEATRRGEELRTEQARKDAGAAGAGNPAGEDLQRLLSQPVQQPPPPAPAAGTQPSIPSSPPPSPGAPPGPPKPPGQQPTTQAQGQQRAPQGQQPKAGEVDDLEGQTVEDLRETAKGEEISLHGASTKADIVKAIRKGRTQK